ncbi:MAG: UvrD-helicase domain-containing protein [Clostridia bacterium]|nr:UvrD-helicase domain-containing protein [Clostridia bacterium]
MNVAQKQEFITLRKKAMEKEFSYLNSEQQACVFAASGPVLVLAGAGSGKTTALINRIACLVRYGSAYESEYVDGYFREDALEALRDHVSGKALLSRDELADIVAVDPVRPWNILAITFTNKAAGELKERLEKFLGESGTDIWASTFHSACVRILRREGERLGYKSGFTIYDSDDSQRVIKEVMEAMHLDVKEMPPRSVAQIISAAKDKMMLPEDLMNSSKGDERVVLAARIYSAYQKKLFEANALDFDDLIMQTVNLFNTCEDVLFKYGNRFSHILVDEYQDTNHAQYMLVKLLASVHGNVCVVGDDDQSIYSFRGAKVENILNFKNEYNGTRIYRLERNYRSTSNILNAANAVIRNNSKRMGKELWTEKGKGSLVTVYEAEDERAEAAYITDTIMKAREEGGSWSDNTVLYRMNAQSNAVEQSLRFRAIPYRIIGGTRFYDRAEVKDMMSYLQVIANPFDTLRLTRIVNAPARGIGATSLQKVTAAAEHTGISLLEAMRRSDEIGGITAKAVGAMKRFTDLITSLSALRHTLPLDEFYEEVLERSGYRDNLIANMSKDPDNRTRLENILELKTNIVYYMNAAEEPSLEGFLEETSLLTDIDRYDDAADAVTLMTVHSSKGLEFPRVFIVGCEEALFPSSRSVDTREGIEEERRLAYVAITRARENLFMTYASQRMLFGRTERNPVSRFVEELPPECIERHQRKKTYVSEYLESEKFSGVPGGGMRRPGQTGTAQRPSQPFGRTAVPKPAVPKPVVPKPGAGAASGVKSDYKVGDVIVHNAFGRGVIMSRRETAGDCLIEIAFDSCGTKKMMLNYAAKFMHPEK